MQWWGLVATMVVSMGVCSHQIIGLDYDEYDEYLANNSGNVPTPIPNRNAKTTPLYPPFFGNNTTPKHLPKNTTTPKPPPKNTTTPKPLPKNTTTPKPPPKNTTTPKPPPKNTTTLAPPKNSTTLAPPKNSTTLAPPKNSTTLAPPRNSTTPKPPPRNTTTPPQNRSTIVRSQGEKKSKNTSVPRSNNTLIQAAPRKCYQWICTTEKVCVNLTADKLKPCLPGYDNCAVKVIPDTLFGVEVQRFCTNRTVTKGPFMEVCNSDGCNAKFKWALSTGVILGQDSPPRLQIHNSGRTLAGPEVSIFAILGVVFAAIA